MKKVSLIVPVYNTEKYLRRCLNSLVNQTFSDIEIIIINDGSTDNSLSIIEHYATNFPDKIKVINSPNQGAGKAKNKGIDIAQGEYIWLVDSDDWLYNDSVEKMYNIAEQYHISMVTCDVQRRFGTIKKPGKRCNTSSLISLSEQPDLLISEKSMLCDKLIKRSLIGDLRMPGLKWEDLALSFVLLADSNKFYHYSERFYNYRMNLNNTTTKDIFKPNPRIIEIFDILYTLEQNFKDRNLYDQYYEQLKHIYITHILRRVADVATWHNSSLEQKRTVINLLINMIELKYNDLNIDKMNDYVIPFNPISMYFLNNFAYDLFDKNLRKESSEEDIKSKIVYTLN